MPQSTRFSNHPDFEKALLDWVVASDCYEGERVIKERKTVYLPATSGQISLGLGYDGNVPRTGQQIYDAYLQRASFPAVVRQTTEALLGVALRKPWAVELPTQLEHLLKTATIKGDSMEDLIVRMLRRVMLYGRMGLLTEIDGTPPKIYLVDYEPTQVINWAPEETGGDRGTVRLVVLREDHLQLREQDQSYNWDTVERYRVLRLDELGAYSAQIYNADEVEPVEVPNFMGKKLQKIPFTLIGSVDTTPEIDPIPMLPLCQVALTIFRTEADYRQTLYISGQETLVIRGQAQPEGDDDEVTVGAGAIIYLTNPEADAKFIGANSKGIPELRAAIENDAKKATEFGLSLLTSGSAAEASDTIRTRVGGRTANLITMVRAVAAGLKTQLDYAAEFVGASLDEVVVTPNFEFVPSQIAVAELNGMIAAKLAGFPIAWSSIYDFARRGGLTEFDVEQELAKIQEEGDTVPAPVVAGDDDDDDVPPE